MGAVGFYRNINTISQQCTNVPPYSWAIWARELVRGTGGCSTDHSKACFCRALSPTNWRGGSFGSNGRSCRHVAVCNLRRIRHFSEPFESFKVQKMKIAQVTHWHGSTTSPFFIHRSSPVSELIRMYGNARRPNGYCARPSATVPASTWRNVFPACFGEKLQCQQVELWGEVWVTKKSVNQMHCNTFLGVHKGQFSNSMVWQWCCGLCDVTCTPTGVYL